jgi:hypothetical protein
MIAEDEIVDRFQPKSAIVTVKIRRLPLSPLALRHQERRGKERTE